MKALPVRRQYKDLNTVQSHLSGKLQPFDQQSSGPGNAWCKVLVNLVVAILKNSEKAPLFSVSERIEMITEAVGPYGNVSVATFNGLLVEFVLEQRAQAILRGVRAIGDYEYELPDGADEPAVGAECRDRLPDGRREIFLH